MGCLSYWIETKKYLINRKSLFVKLRYTFLIRILGLKQNIDLLYLNSRKTIRGIAP